MAIEHFQHIYHLIKEAQNNAVQTVNRQMIVLYWNIGHYINKRIEQENWGNSTIDKLSKYITKQNPNVKGFTARNIRRMRQFYEKYPDFTIWSPLVTKLSWTNNLLILSMTKSIDERVFYLNLAIKERYSKRALERQIKSCVYERTKLSEAKTPPLIQEFPKSTKGIFKDTYLLDFLDLTPPFSEKDLKKALVENLKHFLLELGADFCFVGQEFRVQVGMNDFYIDLLLFHRTLQCLVVLEFKLGQFKPHDLGQLNFYLEAIDSDVKKPHENPSIGILICKGKDDDVVEYALRRSLSPTLIADYETKLIDKKICNYLDVRHQESGVRLYL